MKTKKRIRKIWFSIKKYNKLKKKIELKLLKINNYYFYNLISILIFIQYICYDFKV